jgi:ribosome-associated protein
MLSDVAAIPINRSVTVDDGELDFTFARSGGPGGQHANTSSTKVELRWDVDASPALTEHQRELVRTRLANRINSDGVLVLQSSEYRSQTRNREAVIARFTALLADALRVQTSRRPTKPTRAARQRRLEAKRRRADTKALRRPPPTD